MPKQSKSSLGRGLSGLISKGAQAPRPSTSPQSDFQEIDISKIEPNPYQPRMDINPDAIKELASSIKAEGLLQPIVVRKKGKSFELIAGERRWHACKLLKFPKIHARIVDVSDASSAVIALVENLQRENLNPIDEAVGFSSLIRDFDLTQEQAASRVGKPRTSIANSLRLLNLGQEIQGFLAKNMISVGHAKVLLSVDSPPLQLLLARRIIESSLSVRETEKLAKNLKNESEAKSLPRPIQIQAAVVKDLQKQLTTHFHTPVAIQHGAKKGKLVINYRGNDELNRILEKIGFMPSSTLPNTSKSA